MTRRSIIRLIICLALCFGVSFASGSVTYPEIPTWYASRQTLVDATKLGVPSRLEHPLHDDGC